MAPAVVSPASLGLLRAAAVAPAPSFNFGQIPNDGFAKHAPLPQAPWMLQQHVVRLQRLPLRRLTLWAHQWIPKRRADFSSKKNLCLSSCCSIRIVSACLSTKASRSWICWMCLGLGLRLRSTCAIDRGLAPVGKFAIWRGPASLGARAIGAHFGLGASTTS